MYFTEALDEAISILEGHALTIEAAAMRACRVGEDVGQAGMFITEEEPQVSCLKIRELAATLRGRPTNEHPCVKSPADVDELLRRRIAYAEQEHIVAVHLNNKNRVISSPTLAIGTISSCIVDPKVILRSAITAGASSLILAHNHPSGDTSPSMEDRRITARLREGADLLGVNFLDHIIIGRDWLSMKEAGCLI